MEMSLPAQRTPSLGLARVRNDAIVVVFFEIRLSLCALPMGQVCALCFSRESASGGSERRLIVCGLPMGQVCGYTDTRRSPRDKSDPAAAWGYAVTSDSPPNIAIRRSAGKKRQR